CGWGQAFPRARYNTVKPSCARGQPRKTAIAQTPLGLGAFSRYAQGEAENVAQQRRVLFITRQVGRAVGVLKNGVAGLLAKGDQGRADSAALLAPHDHSRALRRGGWTGQSPARPRQEFSR